MKALKGAIKWIAAIAVICAIAVGLASINGLTVTRTVVTVDGVEVSDAEYKYYLEMTKEQMISESGAELDENGNVKDGFWDEEVDGKKRSDLAKEKAMDELVRAQVVANKAKEAGLTVSDDVKSSINATVNADSGEMKKYVEELLKTTGANKFQLAEYMEKSYLM